MRRAAAAKFRASRVRARSHRHRRPVAVRVLMGKYVPANQQNL